MRRYLPKIDEIVLLEKKKLFPLYVADKGVKSFFMRFELGGKESRDSKSRILQASNRGTVIYKYLMGNRDILIAMKEWPVNKCMMNQDANENIFKFIERDKVKRIKGPFAQKYYEKSDNGELIEKIFSEPLECDLLVGRLRLSSPQIESIVSGIVSFEMGGNNSIAQDITFHLVSENISLRIYDDRGCDVWAKSLNSIRPLYLQMNEWILDYNRKEIDEMFKSYH